MMMRNITMVAAAGAFGLSLATAHAADPVTIQLKWVAQAQFAGYFVAKDKGY
jgi:NitT/TauT family transport system substrate-binding protein